MSEDHRARYDMINFPLSTLHRYSAKKCKDSSLYFRKGKLQFSDQTHHILIFFYEYNSYSGITMSNKMQLFCFSLNEKKEQKVADRWWHLQEVSGSRRRLRLAPENVRNLRKATGSTRGLQEATKSVTTATKRLRNILSHFRLQR